MQQRWLITGSSRGLGRALSEAVLDAGHLLVATARDRSSLSDLVERHGDAVRTAAFDVSDPVAAEAAVQLAVDSFGRLDVVVNNAGYGNVNSIEDTELEDFRRRSSAQPPGRSASTTVVSQAIRSAPRKSSSRSLR